jgi:hypothetical protein
VKSLQLTFSDSLPYFVEPVLEPSCAFSRTQ